ncbi:ATP-binding protein [Xanthomarina gelatinilytica]|uniref:ATP-binding protein n=1 Tax=Xanthomarina gelatinilytica TaxID=1137281 RepID=UPI003AA99DB3
MRYLNKIVFINSANIPYSEIEIDGNVHLIGDQGSGKSTLLRAILFFYNANKVKLGIPREKRGFDDYYFSHANSYIIYEVIKENVPFCVLAYKVNGKVAFRFFDSAYKRELFIDDHNRAFESWDHIRNAFGRHIHYSPVISSYEDYRKIIYGDNKGMKPEFRKYALLESQQFQNIPRTIQNVFLNTNLEAKFIKDTIINSLDEDEFVIDIENYAKNHLRDFESELNDIKIWFKESRKGYVTIRHQAKRVIEKYREFNFLNREKKELAQQLAARMDFIEREKPKLSSLFSKENEVLGDLCNQKENLKEIYKRRERDLSNKIYSLKNDLDKAKKKQEEYEIIGISEIIEKVTKKEALTAEQKALLDEKNLLTSQFAEIHQKFEALISQAQNQHQEFAIGQQAKINEITAIYSDERQAIIDQFQTLIDQIKEDHSEEVQSAQNMLASINEKEINAKNKKAELRYKTFYAEEINTLKLTKSELEKATDKAQVEIVGDKNTLKTTRREWELETEKLDRENNSAINQEIAQQKNFQNKIQGIQNKIDQSKSALYGWLNDHYPHWENTIGKVIDEENVLFQSDLDPKLAQEESGSFYGVQLNLNALASRVKTVQEYQEEIGGYEKEIESIQSRIEGLNAKKEEHLQKLKNKFGRQIKQLNDAIAQNEYTISQNQQKMKNSEIELREWEVKAEKEKKNQLKQLENSLEELASQKQLENKKLESIKGNIQRKITLKTNERKAVLETAEKGKEEKIQEIKSSIHQHKTNTENRINQVKKDQESELVNKGANTSRLGEIENSLSRIEADLKFIKEYEVKVIEYHKDKRELFDLVPQWKTVKTSLEKKQNALAEAHKLELDKVERKIKDQDHQVKALKSRLAVMEEDVSAFENFKKSEIYLDFQVDLVEEENVNNSKTATTLIDELKEKHYKGIEVFKELQQAIALFVGNFAEKNIFMFKVKFNEDDEYLTFAAELKEFIEEDKINEYEKRVNERFAYIISQIGRETTELNSKEAEIEKIIKKINDDFRNKNFVQAIKEMEMRMQKSSNVLVRILIKIKEFNDENSLLLGQANLFTSSDSDSKNQMAVDLLKQLVKELERTKNNTLTLSESFDLQFRIVENDNDSGWVEKLANVGSEGTDVLVKAMINILLLNVFKDSASRKFKDFKLHCMMDEIGRLHPNNVKGILRFANERNILLINGSPTSQNATDYRYTYRLAKRQSAADKKKYVTKINRLVKVNPKVLS